MATNNSNLFIFRSITITPNPVQTRNNVKIIVDLKYIEPDFPHDYPFDYFGGNELLSPSLFDYPIDYKKG